MASRRAAGSMVTTAIPPRPGVAARAESTSSSIANISARRSSDGSMAASRSFARLSSFTGTTAHKRMSEASARGRQNHSRQRLAIFEGLHPGLGQEYRNAQLGDIIGVGFVGNVDVENVGVMPRDSRGAWRASKFRHDLGGRTFDRLAADDR